MEFMRKLITDFIDMNDTDKMIYEDIDLDIFMFISILFLYILSITSVIYFISKCFYGK